MKLPFWDGEDIQYRYHEEMTMEKIKEYFGSSEEDIAKLINFLIKKNSLLEFEIEIAPCRKRSSRHYC